MKTVALSSNSPRATDRGSGVVHTQRPELKWFCALLLLGAVPAIGGNLWITLRAHGRVFSRFNDVPVNDVALVLGTSSRTRGGHRNPFFAGRISAAAELFRAGKVRHLLLSGDNGTVRYDEASEMRRALVKEGVPESAMTLDYAGFRTLDSVARAHDVFGLARVTIVTDDFHAERSVLLARHFGIDAQVFCSRPVPLRWSKKTRLREIAARLKALLDLYVLRTKPHFLGERITLPKS